MKFSIPTPTEMSVEALGKSFVPELAKLVHTDPLALLTPEEAAELLGLSVRTLEAWRQKGGGPEFVSISGRCVRYSRAAIVRWIADKSRATTSSMAAGR